jgi:hypothetical protein
VSRNAWRGRGACEVHARCGSTWKPGPMQPSVRFGAALASCSTYAVLTNSTPAPALRAAQSQPASQPQPSPANRARGQQQEEAEEAEEREAAVVEMEVEALDVMQVRVQGGLLQGGCPCVPCRVGGPMRPCTHAAGRCVAPSASAHRGRGVNVTRCCPHARAQWGQHGGARGAGGAGGARAARAAGAVRAPPAGWPQRGAVPQRAARSGRAPPGAWPRTLQRGSLDG